MLNAGRVLYAFHRPGDEKNDDVYAHKRATKPFESGRGGKAIPALPAVEAHRLAVLQKIDTMMT